MKKVLIFLLLFLTLFTSVIFPNIGAETTVNNLLGFWEGYRENHGSKLPAFIEFFKGNPLIADVELYTYCYNFTDQQLNLTINNDQISMTLLGKVYKGKLTKNTILISAADGSILNLVKKKKEPSLKKIMATTAPRDQRKILYIPASPKDGFYWSYFLALPSATSQAAHKQFRQYLFVDTTNSGDTDNYNKCLRDTFLSLWSKGQDSIQIAEKLGMPILLPAFPRPYTKYRDKNEIRFFCEHQFNRDTATLSLTLKDQQMAQVLKEYYGKIGFDINTLAGLDLQLIAMIKHAQQYLAQKGYPVEPKVFMCGYSASGEFVDRFTALHPEWVKAVAAGAVLDDMVLPLAEYQGEKLIFPIGIYDYQDITRKPFDINKHNSVARLNYMGESDNNNVVPFADCYSNQERSIIIKLWGLDILPRAKSLITLYGQSGGKGMFILDKGIGHSTSKQMKEYMAEFFQANRDSDVPVYPLPKDDQQLIFSHQPYTYSPIKMLQKVHIKDILLPGDKKIPTFFKFTDNNSIIISIDDWIQEQNYQQLNLFMLNAGFAFEVIEMESGNIVCEITRENFFESLSSGGDFQGCELRLNQKQLKSLKDGKTYTLRPINRSDLYQWLNDKGVSFVWRDNK